MPTLLFCAAAAVARRGEATDDEEKSVREDWKKVERRRKTLRPIALAYAAEKEA